MNSQDQVTPLPQHSAISLSPSHALGRFGAAIGTAVRRAADTMLSDRRWLVCVGLFGLIWTIELFVVQAMTLDPPNPPGPRLQYIAPVVRMVFDLVFCFGITFCLRRRWLALIAVLALLLNVALLTYFNYFKAPLSTLTVWYQWRGVLSIGLGGVLALVPPVSTSILSLVLALKLWLLHMASRRPFGVKFALGLGGCFALVYLALFTVVEMRDPLRKIMNTRGVARLGMFRGYLEPWAAEWIYLNGNSLLKEALQEAAEVPDTLTPVETPIPIGRCLVILQVESMGYDVMDRWIEGRELMPAVNAIKNESLYYRLRSPRLHGSADADFVMLCGAPPSKQVLNYNIPKYPYEQALPWLLADRGYTSVALSGSPKQFYNRGRAYGQMGFSRLLFVEDILDSFAVQPTPWGARDGDLCNISKLLLRSTQGRTCHFMITLTSHLPFNMLLEEEKELFPGSTDSAESYFNSIHYTDKVLGQYISGLPQGTTVLMYGDHTAGVTYGDYQSDRDSAAEYVPGIVYNVGQNLAALQKTRASDLATNGRLTLLDLAMYLRHQVAQSNQAIEPATAPDSIER